MRRAWGVVRGTWGITLVEVLVALTILGLFLGITGFALASLEPPRESQQLSDLRRARIEAIQSGTPRTTYHVRFLPDGRAIGPDVHPLTGTAHAR